MGAHEPIRENGGVRFDGRIRFLHIPKTGGSTLSETLVNHFWFTTGQALELGPVSNGAMNAERWRTITKDERQRIRYIYGHSPIFTDIPEIDSFPIITMLREPVSRFKSFCQHVFEGKSPELRDSFPPGSLLDLDDFIASSEARGFDNTQTKMLINHGGYLSSVMIHLMGEQSAAQTALEHLCEKTTFGLQEYFYESLKLYGQDLQCELQPLEVSYNVKTGRLLEFTNAQLERIAELNAIDILVYQKAKEIFMARIRSL